MFQFKAKDLVSSNENITVQWVDNSRHGTRHTHDYIEFVYILDGGGTHNIGDVEYSVKHGDLLFINYGQSHAFTVDGKMTYANILLNPEFMGNELTNSENIFQMLSLTSFEEFRSDIDKNKPFVSFLGRETRQVDGIIEAMFDEFTEKKLGYRSVLKGYMQVLLAKVFRKMQLGTYSSEHEKNASIPEEVLRFIEENCTEKITLSDLAKKCFYNPSYFSRAFKEYTGLSPTDFISAKRTKLAAEMLQNTELSIEEISFKAGFSDKKQFYQKFKKAYGVTPNNFRKSKINHGDVK